MGPFKCPDCGVWWAGLEHRCHRPATTIVTEPVEIGGTFTLKCSCCFDATGHRIPQTATCPVHDVLVTYTTSAATFAATSLVSR